MIDWLIVSELGGAQQSWLHCGLLCSPISPSHIHCWTHLHTVSRDFFIIRILYYHFFIVEIFALPFYVRFVRVCRSIEQGSSALRNSIRCHISLFRKKYFSFYQIFWYKVAISPFLISLTFYIWTLHLCYSCGDYTCLSGKFDTTNCDENRLNNE